LIIKIAILAFTLIANLGFPSISATSHEFEDDFIERTLAIIVRGKKAEITYSIGLNGKTAQKIMDEWSKLAVKPASPTPTKGAPDPPGPQPETDPGKNSGHVLSPELMKLFRTAASKFVTENIVVKIGKKSQRLKLISAEPAARHPFAVTLKWEFALPSEKVVDVEIIDTNFLDFDGASRSAIKVTGDAMLHQSNAAPILIRAERELLEMLTPKERQDAMTIRAKIALADPLQ
jgi:hypothetical protein